MIIWGIFGLKIIKLVAIWLAALLKSTVGSPLSDTFQSRLTSLTSRLSQTALSHDLSVLPHVSLLSQTAPHMTSQSCLTPLASRLSQTAPLSPASRLSLLSDCPLT